MTSDRFIGVVPNNVRAAELYARRGFAPTLLVLTRFGRPERALRAELDPAVERVGPTEVDALEPLWLSLHRHHQAVAPQLGPFVDDRTSWDRGCGASSPAIADTGWVIRLGPADAPLGIAAFEVTKESALWADTWVTGTKTAELEVIIVADEARGQGVGTRLMDSVDAMLAAEGIPTSRGGIRDERDAIELYRRREFRPAWLTMVDFALRGRSPRLARGA